MPQSLYVVIHAYTDRDAVKSLESQVRTQRQSCGEKVKMVSACNCLLYKHSRNWIYVHVLHMYSE